MRCQACDQNLTDFESTRKHIDTHEFVDLCNNCFHSIQQDIDQIEERDDLRHADDDDIDWINDE